MNQHEIQKILCVLQQFPKTTEGALIVPPSYEVTKMVDICYNNVCNQYGPNYGIIFLPLTIFIGTGILVAGCLSVYDRFFLEKDK